jgi:hypothetical protein
LDPRCLRAFHEKASPVKRGATWRPVGGLRAPRPLPRAWGSVLAPSVPRAVRSSVVRPSVNRGRMGPPRWGSKGATPADERCRPFDRVPVREAHTAVTRASAVPEISGLQAVGSTGFHSHSRGARWFGARCMRGSIQPWCCNLRDGFPVESPAGARLGLGTERSRQDWVVDCCKFPDPISTGRFPSGLRGHFASKELSAPEGDTGVVPWRLALRSGS